VRTFYHLLNVDASAPAEDVKRAFRREIARYHPDKVQHLGPEFQEIASSRAAELTEAYRVLMDPELRRKYDASLHGEAPTRPAASTSNTTAAPPAPDAVVEDAPEPATEREEPNRWIPVPETVRQVRATMSDVVRKATLGRMREAVHAVFGESAQVAAAGFDAAFAIGARRGLFRKADADVMLLVKMVPEVNGEAIEEAWPLALKLPKTTSAVCLMLLGSGVSPSRDLSAAVAQMRRRTRNIGPVVIPVDVRDWEALFPVEAPSACRSVIERLKQAG
jgi:hypothetical protein